ncbi:Rpn family recombination-promoting nuclease/putative transposase [Clostridium beijerinckii]|uniref:Rpn family recombination-promoting nuclease/putative transposase n=1 Tax=Clostridium beijerinckii TaxID=1520 RepID=UPI00098C42CB|nr:Rpn family recombination-promoting nuclease/putative transposase [Clostridium beijerinckii]MBA8932931.1 putative transposase/invertase (TIGR01784 family) [Clostridium beijerinckii]NOW06099.1 putative transposase/invertase (TIGR01784 family) [Clostridium beijerinckii]NRU37134.1 putative transposase/invertase (TIGR01784 family) [Clostridium beijerinckii]NSA99587.1 putative transposase/invertase (TIGR01784 family) [Clostridium beijerinckii]NYC00757.1 putative transposase/invertase (TIGR01784 f
MERKILDDGFIMSPKNDFVFKLLFGNENNKDLLIELLNSILKMPHDELEDIELINTELLREFSEDRKGILDVRAKTKSGEHIDIEIQVLYTNYMAERTLFYWSKMYNGQIKSGYTYDKLKKCITINIVDFNCIEINKLHTSFHITEDETNKKLTDVLEIHYLELPKLFDNNIPKDESEPLVQWIMFLQSRNKEAFEMLAEKNEKIKKAYNILEVISKDDNARAAYEAREAELHDQMTRLKSAKEEGIKEGIKETTIKNAKNFLLMGLDVDMVSKGTGLSVDEVLKIKGELN